jgi:Ca2+-binding EF-hand superfamily protein
MRIHWIPALATAAALAAPVAAMAQLTAAREQTFRERDRNGDGVLTQEEYGGHPGNFRAMDTNGDRVLSREEFVTRYRGDAAPPPVAAAPPYPDTFSAIDVNRDNAISRSEWRPDLTPISFWRMDRNHDGLVTRDEFVNPLPEGSAEARFGDLDLNRDGVVARAEWVGESMPFDLLDRNRDNRITVDEYVNPPAAGAVEMRFAALDRNHNGVVNRGEWRGETRSFDLVDLNRDDRITLDEYARQLTGGAAELRFNTLDRNHNGIVNRGEWRGETQSFDVVDRNRDNRITLDEYAIVSTGGTAELRFNALDINRNGILNRGEWRGETQSFDVVDRNRDDRITMDEYVSMSASGTGVSGLEEQFARMDRNRDALLTRAEWTDTTAFRRADRNADGIVTLREYINTDVVYEQPPSVGSAEFLRMDYNRDGVLNRQEWTGTAASFTAYDRNRDGVISREEYLAY